MPLFTKSIQEPKDISDGIRICIMRKPDFNADWDIWMPTLAPSLELLKSYNKSEITWEEYIKQFNDEVISKKYDHIKLLADMAKDNIVTILCWEETPEQCHRRLITEEVLKINPEIRVTIK